MIIPHVCCQESIMPSANVPNETPQSDRRQNHELRQIFESAYLLVEPFFDLSQGQPLEYLAFQRLRENYPDLSHEEVHVIVTASRRVYGERHPRGGAHP
ncbi:MAG: hypothetical protein LBS89_02805 [Zoogloeaceae bacterium]|jgi:hypothetical protein|nr:hypothetical protein [Zoogloeaceae bacterium]